MYIHIYSLIYNLLDLNQRKGYLFLQKPGAGIPLGVTQTPHLQQSITASGPPYPKGSPTFLLAGKAAGFALNKEFLHLGSSS